MPESPDVPWARPDDDHGKPPQVTGALSSGVRFLLDNLRHKGAILFIGCEDGHDAAYLVQAGFEVHAMNISSAGFADIERHGVRTHCASPTEFWLFENGSFDSVIDLSSYSGEPDPDKRSFYRSELSRVLRPDGHFLISIPETFGNIEKEFGGTGFVIVASQVPKEGKTLDIIFSKKKSEK
jgi:SAM-dependent methyltransferase